MTKALVTGGAGFVGAALVRYLLNIDYEVVVYDNFFCGKREHLAWRGPNLKVIEGDVLDAEKLSQTVFEFAPDIVFHLAAIHYIPYCNAHPRQTLRVNVEGTAAVLEACKQTPPQRLFFTSTAAVYPISSDPISEETMPNPLDIYGLSKWFGEQLVTQFCAETDVRCVIARLFNVYGPGETNPHLMPEIVRQLKAQGNTVRLGNLEPKRDYVFVEDVVRIVHALTMFDGQASPKLICSNVATGREYSVHDIVKIFAAVLQREIIIQQDPTRLRPSDRLHLCGDITRLQEYVGLQPLFDLQTGIAASWNCSA